MPIFKSFSLGAEVFIIGVVIYMFLGGFLGRRFIPARGIGMISTGSPFLWVLFAASLAIGYVIAMRGLWILQGVLLGLTMFIVGTSAVGIAYNRHLMKLYPQPPGASVGISVRHLRLKLFVVLICSVGLGLAIV